jgi:NADH:ubiquinone oxidoreductase subunit 6 (subunit J)
MDEFDNTSEELGRTLFGTTDATGYGLIVFFIGLLLLVALLGGIFLAKEERE